MNKYKYKDIYKNGLFGDGVLSEIKPNLPWWNQIITVASDIYFYDKYQNVMVGSILANQVENPMNLINLSELIETLFAKKWSKTYDALEIEYKPLENYNKVQTYTETRDRTGTLTQDATDTLKNDRVTSGTTASDSVNDSLNKTSGFNSNTMVEDTSTNNINTTNQTVNETIGDTGTNTRKNNENTKDTENVKISDLVTGNIGVTTSQQMLESELDLRKKHIMHEIIINDIANVLLTKVYL